MLLLNTAHYIQYIHQMFPKAMFSKTKKHKMHMLRLF